MPQDSIANNHHELAIVRQDVRVSSRLYSDKANRFAYASDPDKKSPEDPHRPSGDTAKAAASLMARSLSERLPHFRSMESPPRMREAAYSPDGKSIAYPGSIDATTHRFFATVANMRISAKEE